MLNVYLPLTIYGEGVLYLLQHLKLLGGANHSSVHVMLHYMKIIVQTDCTRKHDIWDINRPLHEHFYLYLNNWTAI
jgi:hypothetical protein